MGYNKLIYVLALLWGMTLSVQAQQTPCTGSEYTSNQDFFRASASALSGDATASKKKAVITARTQISNQIKQQAQSAIASQNQWGEAETTQFLSVVQAVIQQEVAGLKVICEEGKQTGGKYQTSVVVELTKADVLAHILTQVKGHGTLKGVFDEGKFKQAF